jgi:hypothetical protein
LYGYLLEHVDEEVRIRLRLAEVPNGFTRVRNGYPKLLTGKVQIFALILTAARISLQQQRDPVATLNESVMHFTRQPCSLLQNEPESSFDPLKMKHVKQQGYGGQSR